MLFETVCRRPFDTGCSALSLRPGRRARHLAASAILIDGESGRVLYAQNAEEERPIASITKLMTALVALESGKSLDDVVTIQAEDTRTEGSAST